MANLVKLSIPVCEEKDAKMACFFIQVKGGRESDHILRAALSSLWWVLHTPSAVAVPWTRSRSVPKMLSIYPCRVLMSLLL